MTKTYLEQKLHYNPDTGIFIWIGHIHNRKNGQIAGYIDKSGYVIIGLNYKNRKAHRLAFLYMKGYMPEYIDHIDGNPTNNKWSNLRECTTTQNSGNRKISKNNSNKKYKGVRLMKDHYRTKNWMAQIDSKYIGYFETAEEAAKAYDLEAIKKYGEFAKTNFPLSNYE